MLHFKLLTTLSLLLLFLPVWSQVNVKVGYNIGYTNPVNHNLIYQDFNKKRPWLTKSFKEIQNINGLQLGLRYRFDNNFALEANWQNQFHRQTASGITPVSKRDSTQSISFRHSSLGLGLEYFIGKISWGATYNYDQIQYKAASTNVEKQVILKDNGWSSHFFIAYNIQGNSLFHISIRPYAQIYWQPFNLSSIHKKINDDNGSLEESYNAFGIMLVFYNGQK